MSFTLEPENIPPSKWGFKSEKEALKLSKVNGFLISVPATCSLVASAIINYRAIIEMDLQSISFSHFISNAIACYVSFHFLKKKKLAIKYLELLMFEKQLAKDTESYAKLGISSIVSNLKSASTQYVELSKTLIPRAASRLRNGLESKYFDDLNSCISKVEEIMNSIRIADFELDKYELLLQGKNNPPVFSLFEYAENIQFIEEKIDMIFESIRVSKTHLGLDNFIIEQSQMDERILNLIEISDELSLFKKRIKNLKDGAPAFHLYETIK